MQSFDKVDAIARITITTEYSKDKFIVLDKHGEDDYSIAWVDNLEDENDGCSLRGTWDDIIDDIAENYEFIGKKTRQDLDRALKELRFAK